MRRCDGATAADLIFVDDRNRVNSQFGVSNVPDHHLARLLEALPEATIRHVVPDLSTGESYEIYADPLPIFVRIISDKNEVRNSPLLRAVNKHI
jgi:hypothetical protein